MALSLKTWNKKLTTTEEGSRRLGIGIELGIVLVHEERNELLRDGPFAPVTTNAAKMLIPFATIVLATERRYVSRRRGTYGTVGTILIHVG